MVNNKEAPRIRYGPPIDPSLRREIRRCEGLDIEDVFNPKFKEPFAVYLCAPLQPTSRKSALQHIFEVASKASLIENATYEGKEVKCFMPHINIFPWFNELAVPPRRRVAIAANDSTLRLCDALIKIGTRISSGMKGEIDNASDLNLPLMSFGEFKKKLTNLPSSEKSRKIFEQIIQSLPPGLFTEHIIRMGKINQ